MRYDKWRSRTPIKKKTIDESDWEFINSRCEIFVSKIKSLIAIGVCSSNKQTNE